MKDDWRVALAIVLACLLCVLIAPQAGAEDVAATDPPEAAPLPKCWPKKLNARLQRAPQAKWVAFWGCDNPRGVSHYALYFDWEKAAEWAGRGLLTDEEYNAAYGEVSHPMTEEERVFAYGPMDTDGDGNDDSLVSRYGSRALVKANGTAISRPVYPLLENGQRGTTAVSGARVAIGARCRVGTRAIDSAGKGTSYYGVKGLPNIATADPDDVLGDVVAVCEREDRIGVN